MLTLNFIKGLRFSIKVDKRVTRTGMNLLRFLSFLSGNFFENSLVIEVQESTERTFRIRVLVFNIKSRSSKLSSSGAVLRLMSLRPIPFEDPSGGSNSRDRGSFRGKKFTVPSEDSSRHLDVGPHHQGCLPFLPHPSTLKYPCDFFPVFTPGKTGNPGGWGVV